MATINQMDRTAAAALIQDQFGPQILKSATAASVALSSFRTVNMGTKNYKIPVLAALPSVGWVDEAISPAVTSIKPTSTVSWSGVSLVAEELAVIVPIPTNVLDDATFDVFAETKPLIVEAMGMAVDAAVFFGTAKPASWGAAIVPAAVAAGNVVSEATSATTDLATDISATMALVEDDGFDVNFMMSRRSLRGRLRALRTTQGDFVFIPSMTAGLPGTLYGETLTWSANGAWAGTNVLIAGDATKAIMGIRQDIRFDFLKEATIGSNTTNPINLAERDMIAIRATFRVAFAVATPVNRDVAVTGYPFAVLTA